MEEPDWELERERIEACKTEIMMAIGSFSHRMEIIDGVVIVTALSELLSYTSVTLFGHQAAVEILHEVTNQLETKGPFE
jgi:hypothetical protein